jgi:hypothetical protein
MAAAEKNESHLLDPVFLQVRGQVVRNCAPIALLAHSRVEPPGQVLDHRRRDDAIHGADELSGFEIEKGEMVAVVLGPIPEIPRSDVARVFGRENAQRRLMMLVLRQLCPGNDR